MKFLIEVLLNVSLVVNSNAQLEQPLMVSVQPFSSFHDSVIAQSQSKNLAIRSAGQAAQLVSQSMGGKVLKVQSAQVNGNPGYRVKLLKNDGSIVSVSVDAVTGRISG